MQEKVTIVIPAFNEEAAVGRVVGALRAELPGAEVIVVDDGSSDRTAELAGAAGATVLRHGRNFGYGASLRTGILASERDYVLFCDADGQHSARDVARLIAAAAECDMVVGARGRTSHVPLVRAPGKFVLRHFANFLAGETIPDLNSGLRLIRRRVILKYLHLMPAGFSFSTTSTFALLKGSHLVSWVPIEVVRREGKSTVRQLRHGPQTMLLMLRLTVLFEPLKVFLSVAGLLALLTLLSLGIDIWTSGHFDLGDSTVLLSISTLLVFMFGLVCDQVSALRRELHD
jgi:glycosyltransferase involved in cell wall biosynthesis